MARDSQRPRAAHVQAAIQAASQPSGLAARQTGPSASISGQAPGQAFLRTPAGLAPGSQAPHVQRAIASGQSGLPASSLQMSGQMASFHPAAGRAPGRIAPQTPAKKVIQRAREDVPDRRESPGMLIPDLEMNQYGAHVRNRVLVFFITTARAFRAILARGNSVPSSLFSDHARAQTGSGYRGDRADESVRGELRFDAAHYMNTTLDRSTFAAQAGLPESDALVQELFRTTAATSDQFQTSNITADKVIDRLMTAFKASMAQHASSTGAWSDTDIANSLRAFLTRLRDEAHQKSEQYHQSETSSDIQIKLHSYFAAAGMAARMLGDFDQTLQAVLSELG